jgi:hypothetical protein
MSDHELAALFMRVAAFHWPDMLRVPAGSTATEPSSGENVTCPAPTCWQLIVSPTANAVVEFLGTVTVIPATLSNVTREQRTSTSARASW